MGKMKNLLKKMLPERIILCFWHYPKAVLAALFYNFPARKLIVIGVAGTKGKTTSAHLISQILEAAGKKTALISTASVKIAEKEELNKIKMTTPSPFYIQKFLREAVRAGCQYAVMEISSHALIQHRTFGIPFHVVVLTNMMPDHLEYHKTAENYSSSHQKMLKPCLRHLILNGDDSNLKFFLETPFLAGQKIIYGIRNKETIFAKDIHLGLTASSFKVETPDDSIEINLPLLGKFNIYNSLTALAVGLSQKIKLKNIKNALEKSKGAPGRMEKIDSGQNFQVIVDYAHSPDSLNNFFEAVFPLKKNTIITVFGACGERDASQRPLMGKIIDKNCDYIIITNDDPYGESPEKIAKEVMSGVENKEIGKNIWKILDRTSAIKKAVALAQKDDLVLILGKGAEQWQVFKDKKIPWDDRKITKEILISLKKD